MVRLDEGFGEIAAKRRPVTPTEPHAVTAEPARIPERSPDAPPQPVAAASVSWATIGLYSAPTIGVGFMFLLVNLYIMPFGTVILQATAAAQWLHLLYEKYY